MAEENYTKTIYKYDGKSFDAIEGYSDKQMQDMLASFFPEVAGGKKEEKIKDGVRTVSFSKQAGRLGSSTKIAKKILKCKAVDDIMPYIESTIKEMLAKPLEHSLPINIKLSELCRARTNKNGDIIERMKSICPTISADSTLIA